MYDYYSDLNPEVTPGQFDSNNSVGRIIPEKHFPMFDIKLGVNDFLAGEEVTSNKKEGTVESWNSRLGILKISSGDDFEVDDIIAGQTSNTRGIASSITSYDSDIKLGPYSLSLIHN